MVLNPIENDRTMLQRIQNEFQDVNPQQSTTGGHRFLERFSMGTIDQNPVSEWDTNILYLSLTFPTLYPTGEADLNDVRIRSVKPADYYEHLMRYEDGRFAQHPRFRYVAFNMLMRKQASQKGTFFCKRNSKHNKMSLEELKDVISKGDSDIANQIAFFGNTLRGTKPYWQKASREIEAYVHNLGAPSVFFTVSAADHQWWDMQRLMPNFDQYSSFPQLDTASRSRMAWQNLQDNPHIAAAHLENRFEIFFKITQSRFHIEDFWYRYEWQARGSGHIHGFFWLDRTKNISFPDPYIKVQSTEQKLLKLKHEHANYWSNKVLALNPGWTAQLPAAIRHPCNLPFHERQNTVRALGEFLNRVQKTYCLQPRILLKKEKGYFAMSLSFSSINKQIQPNLIPGKMQTFRIVDCQLDRWQLLKTAHKPNSLCQFGTIHY